MTTNTQALINVSEADTNSQFRPIPLLEYYPELIEPKFRSMTRRLHACSSVWKTKQCQKCDKQIRTTNCCDIGYCSKPACILERKARFRKRLLLAAAHFIYMKTARDGKKFPAVAQMILTIPRADISRASRTKLEKLVCAFVREIRKTNPRFSALGIIDIGTPDNSGDSGTDSYDSNLHFHLLNNCFIPADIVLKTWRAVTGNKWAYARVQSSGFYKSVDYFSMRAAGVLGHKAEGFYHISSKLSHQAYYNTLYKARVLHYYLPRGHNKAGFEFAGLLLLKDIARFKLNYSCIYPPKLVVFIRGLLAWLLKKPGRCPDCEGKLRLIEIEHKPPPAANAVFFDATPTMSARAYPLRLLDKFSTIDGSYCGRVSSKLADKVVLNKEEIKC